MRGYLQLLRPANVVTAMSNILAGYAIAGLGRPEALPWLLASTAGLYGGGVVLNDYFDRDLDAVERPERPIPGGRVPASHAAALGALLLGGGVLAAWQAGWVSGLVGAAIAGLVLLYDAVAKRSATLGPPTMGSCRAVNLLLGMSAVPAAMAGHAWLALLPFVYIWSVTLQSRHEVYRTSSRPAGIALAGVSVVVLAAAVLVALSFSDGMPDAVWPFAAVVLLALFASRVLGAFWWAWRTAHPQAVRNAVRAGVLSLTLLDAILATLHAGTLYGLLVLAVAALAYGLARLFAVT
jgi:4-hydroxybenzoate polyprenyltransferase